MTRRAIIGRKAGRTTIKSEYPRVPSGGTLRPCDGERFHVEFGVSRRVIAHAWIK
jgi:hypothetical protein